MGTCNAPKQVARTQAEIAKKQLAMTEKRDADAERQVDALMREKTRLVNEANTMRERAENAAIEVGSGGCCHLPSRLV